MSGLASQETASPLGPRSGRGRFAWFVAGVLVAVSVLVAILLPDRSYYCFSCRTFPLPRLPNLRLTLRVAVGLTGLVLAGAVLLLASPPMRSRPPLARAVTALAALPLVAGVFLGIAVPSDHFCPRWSCGYGSPLGDHIGVRSGILATGIGLALVLLVAGLGRRADRRLWAGVGAGVFLVALGAALMVPPRYICQPGEFVGGRVSENNGPWQVACGQVGPVARTDPRRAIQLAVIGFGAVSGVAIGMKARVRPAEPDTD